MTFFLQIVCALSLLSACRGMAPRDRAVERELVAKNAQERLCAGSRGSWHKALQGCLCADGELFFASHGCSAGGLDGPLAHGLAVYSELDSTDLVTMLRGLTVPTYRLQDPPLGLGVSHWGADDMEMALNYATNNMYVSYDENALRNSELVDIDFMGACKNLTVAMPAASASVSTACDNLGKTLEALLSDDESIASALVYKRISRRHGAEQLAVANLPRHFGSPIYRMVGTREGFYVRTLQFNVRRRVVLEVLLSPMAKVMGGQLRIHTPLDTPAKSLLKKESIYFDNRFNPVRIDEAEAGSRQVATRGAQTWIDATRSRIESAAPARALFIESAIDLGAERVLSHLQLRHEAAASLARSGDLLSPLFFEWAPDPVEIALQLSTGSSEGGQHGTGVAYLLAEGIPDALLSLMSASDGDWTDPTRVPTMLKSKIAKECPSVVNILQDFAFNVANCEEAFGPVFNAFRENVLFVTAAGNDGMKNAADVCPASLAHAYENVVSVGGTAETNTPSMHAASNYGAKFVEIAAPFCSQTIRVDDGVETEVRECGTSFAAPVVANAALRLMAKMPALSPAKVKRLLLASCSGSGVDVACGGAFDISLFSSNAVTVHQFSGGLL